jgi:hypothetical protein
MKKVDAFWRTVWSAVTMLVVWLSVSGEAWAQPAKKDEGAGGASYVLPYFLVIFCVALGLLVALRSARRSDRAKPKEYEAVAGQKELRK